jgi:predicted ArsR family transcriptional regulator
MVDRLEAVGDPELRQAFLLVRARPGPITADEAAAALGVHRNVARARLERLREAGLVLVSFERRTGRSGPGAGRPAKLYAVAPELTPIEFPDRHYGALLPLLIESMPQRDRQRRLREVGASFARELLGAAHVRPARTVERGLQRVCVAVGKLGYHASVESVDGDEASIATATCPLRPLVRSSPDAAAVDRGMWSGLVAGAIEGVRAADVVCTTEDCSVDDAPCRVRIRLVRP